MATLQLSCQALLLFALMGLVTISPNLAIGTLNKADTEHLVSPIQLLTNNPSLFSLQNQFQSQKLLFISNPPSRITNYSIVAELNPLTHTVNAVTTINYVNPAETPLDEVVFHLYPNAFRPQGELVLEAVRYVGSNLTYSISGSDSTVLTVDITMAPGPGSLAVGANVTLVLEYQVLVPNTSDRFGWVNGTFLAYNLGNWHPIVAVYDDRGWHRAPYTYMGESFYSDVANYDVYLTVPNNYIIAATGKLQTITSAGGQRTWYWHANAVRDFTWCASPEYLTTSIMVNGVNVTSYYTVAHEAGGDRVLEIAEQCLSIFGNLFCPYAWNDLHIVETDFWAGGMEYPQLVMIASSLYGDPSGLSTLAYVVAHEIGHEWLPFTIGTDSYAEPWIDEGFASYCELVFVEYVYGFDNREAYREYNLENYWQYVDARGDLSLNRTVTDWESGDWYDYRQIVYKKASLVLEMLRYQLGNETFYQAWEYIFQQVSHTNIRGTDLQALFEEAVGSSLEWFFTPWVFESGVVTLTLVSASTYPTPEGWVVDFQLDQLQPTPVALYVPISYVTFNGIETSWVWMEAGNTTTHRIIVPQQIFALDLDPQNLLLCRYQTLEISVVPIFATSPQQYLVIIGGVGLSVVLVTVIFLFIRQRRRIKVKARNEESSL